MRNAESIARRTFIATVGLCLAALAAGAARGAGPVVGWGFGSIPKITASAISAGGAHDCEIEAGSGAVVCWGRNYEGQAAA